MTIGKPGPARQGRLLSRPSRAARQPPGARQARIRRLPLDDPMDALLLVPADHRGERPIPLMVGFHGAGGDGRQMVRIVGRLAEERGFMLLAPESQGASWDVIEGAFGPDVAALDRTLARVFAEFAVEPSRIAVAGFSDGASYALSLGLANGALFTDVLAFSPGFVAAPRRQGRPRLFVSHGVDDDVLPIDLTSRQLVPQLRGSGYRVDYREFPGGHEIPTNLLHDAVHAFMSG